MTEKYKEILFDESARRALKDGLNQLADVVTMTLGPRGRNVAIAESFGSPTITTDGYRIAKDMEVKEGSQNLGVALGKEVASKIKEKAGDGTTTGILLLRALVVEGTKQIAMGASPIDLKRGMEKTVEALLKQIDRMAVTLKGVHEIQQIAQIAASHHPEVGQIIASCFEKLGKEANVSIEEGKSTETVVEWVSGMQLNQGYASAHFVTNLEKMVAELEHPYVLITDKKISSIQDLLPLLQQTALAGRALVIVAEDVEADVLATLVMNKLRSTLKVAAIKAPGFGESRKALLEDLAILTGGELISEEKGMNLRNADFESLGQCEKIVIGKEKTSVIGGIGLSQEIKAREAQIADEIQKTSSSYEKEKLEKRKASLHGGVAVIRVGAVTESEMKKKKHLYEDSLHSTRSALTSGIVVGGGVTLLKASLSFEKPFLKEEEKIGLSLVLKACEIPLRQIAMNTGYDGSLILQEVLQAKPHFGFNALSEKVEDLLQAGVIDSAQVVKESLKHASSMAGVILLTEAVLLDGTSS